jgi:hypothetical protein
LMSSVTPKESWTTASTSSVKRQIAATTPSPPRIVTAPSNLFDNAPKQNADSIFLTPPVAAAKWDPIINLTLLTVKQPGGDDNCRDMIPGGLTNLLAQQQKKIERAEQSISPCRQPLRPPYI